MTTSQKQQTTESGKKGSTVLGGGVESVEKPVVSESECSECGGVVVEDEARGEFTCKECGLVVSSDSIDRGPDWRSFSDGGGDGERHVGAPLTNTLHDKGLSTDIDWRDRDANGNALSADRRMQMQRLRKWNKRCKAAGAREKNLRRALSEIARMSSALGLDDRVEETAGVLYRRCLDEDMLPGRSIEGMSSACLYAASRICNTPRSLNEIHPVSQVAASHPNNGGSELNRAYLYLLRELELEIEPVDPREYLNRVLTGVDVSDTECVRQTAVELLDEYEEANMHSGCSPMSLAAAAVYAGCGLCEERVTQGVVSDAAGVCETTIRARYQEMVELYKDCDDVAHEFNLGTVSNFE